MATWRVDIHNRNSGTARVSDLPIAGGTFGWVLNSPGGFEFDLKSEGGGATWAWDDIAPAERELRVYRNATLVYEGDVTRRAIDPETRSVKIGGQGILWRLRRRLVMDTLLYDEVAQQTILWNLIAHTQAQPSGALGITQGAHSGGTVTRSRDYCLPEHPNIGEAIDELLGLDDGLDIAIGPEPGFASSKVLRTWNPSKGTDVSGSVTIDLSNASRLELDEDAEGVISRALTEGGDDCNPPESDLSDAGALTRYGLMQEFESIESGRQRDVDAHNAELLRTGLEPHGLIHATLYEAKAFAWGAVTVGDVVSVDLNQGAATFTKDMRALELGVLLELGGTDELAAFYTMGLDSVT